MCSAPMEMSIRILVSAADSAFVKAQASEAKNAGSSPSLWMDEYCSAPMGILLRTADSALRLNVFGSILHDDTTLSSVVEAE